MSLPGRSTMVGRSLTVPPAKPAPGRPGFGDLASATPHLLVRTGGGATGGRLADEAPSCGVAMDPGVKPLAGICGTVQMAENRAVS